MHVYSRIVSLHDMMYMQVVTSGRAYVHTTTHEMRVQLMHGTMQKLIFCCSMHYYGGIKESIMHSPDLGQKHHCDN